MSIPQLSQEMICRYVSSKSWQRGEAYYHDGYLRRVVKRGELITAEVEGNDIRPYQVSIGLDGPELGTVYCSCPSGISPTTPKKLSPFLNSKLKRFKLKKGFGT